MDVEGRFRFQVPALRPNRHFRFHIAFDRRLSEQGQRLFKDALDGLLRREFEGARDLDVTQASALVDGIRVAFDRAMNEGRPGAPELRTLIEVLEARPELDPRNPRSALFLSPEARDFVGAPVAMLESRALGEAGTGAARSLAAVDRPEDAGAFRDRQRGNAQALRELREWLQALVLPGASQRRHVDALIESGALRADEIDRLVALASLGQGEIRRAENWAESLEAYAYEAERALLAGDRALAALAAQIEGQALATVVRQTLDTEPVTSSAGVHLSMDLGLLYAFEVEKGSLYVSACRGRRPWPPPRPRASPGAARPAGAAPAPPPRATASRAAGRAGRPP